MIDSNTEILIMLSDQHAGQICGFAGDPVVRTPNLDRLAAEGISFTNAYTPCPLCVPARAGLLTGRYPFRVGVGDNVHAIASCEPTFAHCLSLAGYDTTLIGRMHFMGADQLHGFERRIGKDICTIHQGVHFTGEPGLYTDYSTARFHGIHEEEQCASLQYDRYVVALAKEYLSQPHEKKQAIVVGTYMPHMPLGAPKEKVEYYRDKVRRTVASTKLNYPCSYLGNNGSFSGNQMEELIECRANYYAMIETEDELIGEVHQEYQNYLRKKGSKGIFIYISDHGDHMGDKGRIGKSTFFEMSAKVPMIIAGDGISHQVVHTPVSLLDLSRTLCEIAGGPVLPLADGKSLMPVLEGKALPASPVFSELLGRGKNMGEKCYGIMVRYKQYKLITYRGFEDEDLLFDIENDPAEEENLIKKENGTVALLKQMAEEHAKDYDILFNRMMETAAGSPNDRLMSAWGREHLHFSDDYTWIFNGRDGG